MGWRPRPESNRDGRICSPLRNHSATRPLPPRAERPPPIQRIGLCRKACFQRGRPLALCKGGAGLLNALAKTPDSLIAQLVEQSTVNRSVAGSSPAQGAKSHFSPNWPCSPPHGGMRWRWFPLTNQMVGGRWRPPRRPPRCSSIVRS